MQLQSRRADILLITPVMTIEILEKVNQLRAAGHSVIIDHVTIEAQEGVS